MTGEMITSGVFVSGAGTVASNGVYLPDGEAEGKPKFVKGEKGQPADQKQEKNLWTVEFKRGDWAICNPAGDRYYLTRESGTRPPGTGWSSNHTGSQHPAPVVEYDGALLVLRQKPGCPNNVLNVQERVWKQRKFTDALVICAGERFEAHRSTLSAASPVFEAAFASSMLEGLHAQYEIKDSTPQAVEGMLRFIYTGCTDVSDTELCPLLDLAVQYDLGELANATARRMLVSVAVENVCAYVQTLKRHHEKMASLWDEMLTILQNDRALLTASY